MIRTQMIRLEEQTQKFEKIASNIPKLQIVQAKYKQKIDQLQKQLLVNINSIALQLNRKKVLEELVQVVRFQVYYQNKRKNKYIQQKEATIDKKLANQLSQIDKISEKFNKQISKINKLKELANKSRSQRVICSSMFKKLQKQIKFYEQVYKNLLIQNHFFLSSNDCSPNKHLLKFQKEIGDHQNNRLKFSNFEEPSGRNYEINDQDSEQSSAHSIDLSMYKHKQNKSNILCFELPHPKQQKPQPKKIGQKEQQKLAYTRQMLKSISQYNILIKQIMIHTQFNSVQAIIQHFSQVQKNNEQLLTQINSCQTAIQRITQLNQKINQQLIQDYYTSDTQSAQFLDLGLVVGCHYELQLSILRKEEKNQYIDSFKEILSLFQMELNSWQSNQLISQKIALLDSNIEKLCQLVPNRSKGTKAKKNQNVYGQTLVSCVIQRMERYSQSQKIFDRNSLIQQYHKEIGRGKFGKSRRHDFNK